MLSQSIENRFIFNLFDLLLCGVIVLVILREWVRGKEPSFNKHQALLSFGFCAIGASFALGAAASGVQLFFERRLPEDPLDLLIHAMRASGWLLLLSSAFSRPLRRGSEPGAVPGGPSPTLLMMVHPGLYLAGASTRLQPTTTTFLDLGNLFLLAFAVFFFHRRPLGGQNLGTSAVALLFVSALLHLGSSWPMISRTSPLLWTFEQFACSLSLLVFAFAIGETSRDLFDKVFVRLQVTFILLASVMILVMTETATTEYLASVRGRTDQLARFVRAQVDYFLERHEPLRRIVEREDLLQRITLDFGNLPELNIVRIIALGEVASFEMSENGRIDRELAAVVPGEWPRQPNSEEYFAIQTLPLARDRLGEVQFYGARAFLRRDVRKRILLIFSLFTGMVVLSTLTIGLVVSGASATIRRQAREIEEVQKQLLQASKLAAIGELAAGVAHEINNPVTTILSRASLLLSEQDARLRFGEHEDLRAIVSQAQRITQITRGLLIFSRQRALSLEPTPILPVIEAGIQSVDERLGANQISVEKGLPTNLPRVLAEKDSLARAFENLFHNAIDAMPDGGTLRIEAAREDAREPRLRLLISDTGVGISEEHLGHIFDPFFTTKDVGKGTGLGLSIVHGIIKEHRGTITVESRPGVGTKFTILLPTEE